MNLQAHLEDYRWLVEDGAVPWLHLAAEDSRPTLTLARRLRQDLSIQRTHLLLQQVELRRRAAAKFPQAQAMFFTPTGLEQATDYWVAGYKAVRFTTTQPVADLCCGIGGDLLALAARGPAVGVDRDPVLALLAEANLRAMHRQGSSAADGLPGNGAHPDTAGHSDTGSHPVHSEGSGLPSTAAEVHCMDATTLDLQQFAAWHIDPDRRPHGRRTTHVELHEPDAATIGSLLGQHLSAAVKLAPAATVPEQWSQEAELEWISRQRQCRQLVAWFGGLADQPGKRRATILLDSGSARPPASRTLVGVPSSALPVAPRVGRYVFDPDPAVLASHLTAALAREHALAAIAADIPYLTADRPIADPALACFEVSDVLPLERKRLRSLLESRGIGRLEIKKRGIPDDPERLRRQLRLRGDQSAVLLIAPIAGTVTAILARRLA